MTDTTIRPIYGNMDLTGKVVLLKSWQTYYDKAKPYRHLIRRVIGQDMQYVEMRPLYSGGANILERLYRSSIDGIMSEEYAEQLLMWETLTK